MNIIIGRMFCWTMLMCLTKGNAYQVGILILLLILWMVLHYANYVPNYPLVTDMLSN